MHAIFRTNTDNHDRTSPLGKVLRCVAWFAILFGVIASTGCSRLRLPAIDPTGSCLFQPLPTTTSLALPGSAGEGCCCWGCFSGLGNCLQNCPLVNPPAPAFTTPVDPPPCSDPQADAIGGAVNAEPCVPGPACNGQCADGPPAVLLGQECKMSDLTKLPDRGERGCILLSPQRIVAPVGGEVILLSGVCGTDGYLQTGQPLEWMLTPESVGTFLQVGDDDPGLLHRLAGIKRSEKKDPSYAHGVTSTKPALITRGNLDPSDDVRLEKGQTWLSIASPTEGVSRVTVLAPDSECWDQRKATATIYWIDARWVFPAPQRVPAGTPVDLTTRVTRSENSIPAVGWKVRYEIQQPELARFAGTDGSDVVEVEVDENGNATAELLPIEGAAGAAVVNISVIRPGGRDDNMPTMTLGQGQALVTWSSPQLRVEAFGPEVASFNVPYLVKAIVSNPGTEAINNVQVELTRPDGTVLGTTDQFADLFPGRIVWNIPRIDPQTEVEIFADVTAQNSNVLTFNARSAEGLAGQAVIRTNIYRPSLTMTVRPRQDQVEAGQTATFDIVVTNTGDRPLDDVRLRAEGGEAMTHFETGNRNVQSDREEGPLQPGQTWPSILNFVPAEAGRRCITVEATADGGQRVGEEACVIVINPIPVTPALSVTLESNDRFTVGETRYFNGRVTNTGEVPLDNVRAVMVFDPQLRLRQATRGADQSRLGEYLLSWEIPRLEPGGSTLLQGVFEVVASSPRSRVVFTAESAQGARGEATKVVEILPGQVVPPPQSPPSSSDLPPAVVPPRIPTGPAPDGGDTRPDPGFGNAPVAPPLPSRSGQLQLSVRQREISPRANAPIPYSIAVTNDSDELDRNVVVEFAIPAGVRVVSVTQTMNPQPGIGTQIGNLYSLDPIRNLRVGETVTYELVLISSIPQTFDLQVEATSDLRPSGVQATETTRVE